MMKKVKYSFYLLFLLALTSFSFKSNIQVSECEVSNFYKSLDAEHGTMVLTSRGELENAELILIPTTIDEGNYEIDISRKEQNVYKLEGTDYYVETRYCYEYATYSKAVLKVTSRYGYTKGTIYFQ